MAWNTASLLQVIEKKGGARDGKKGEMQDGIILNRNMCEAVPVG